MLSSFSVKKPYTVIVAIIIIAVLGVVSFLNMTTDLMPSMNMPYAIVTTTYVGASPEEVEEAVTKNIEQSMTTISNIKNVSSTSSENFSMVMLEFNQDVNMDTAILEMREKLDVLTSYFPDEVQNPNIMKINPSMMPVMAVAVSVSDQSEYSGDPAITSQFISEKLVPEVESINGVAAVTSMGLIDNLVNIEVNQSKVDELNKELETFVMNEFKKGVEAQLALAGTPTPPGGLTDEMLKTMVPADQMPEIPEIIVTDAMLEGVLKGQNFSMPTGNITDNNVSYLVKTGDKIRSLEELRGLLLTKVEGFREIRLEDVADILELDTAGESYAKVNNEAGVLLTLTKQADFSTAEITKAADVRFDELSERYEGVHFSTLMDQGDYVNIMIKAIFSNIIIGAVLAALILLLFLKSFRSTFVISLSIVVSVVTAYVLMYFSGITLNVISMGGLALGIGMLVDNSIVVIENIYRMRNEGMPAKQAAIEGAKQVSGAILASTITTIIVFVPILFTEGFTRKIFMDLGLTISFSLIASLVVALTLVPTAAATVLSTKPIRENKTFDKIKNGYAKLLESTLNHKWVVYILVIVLLGGSAAGALTLGTELLPETDMGNFMVSLKMPNDKAKTDAYDDIDKTMEIIAGIEGVETVGGIYGGSSGGGDMMSMAMGGGGNTATMYVLLDEERPHDITTSTVGEEIRKKTDGFDYELTVNATGADLSALTGGEVVVNLYARELDDLRAEAINVADAISKVDGVIEVDDGTGVPTDELRIMVNKDKAMARGIAVANVFQEVNALIAHGNVATSVTENGVDYDIYVNKEGAKVSIDDIKNHEITTATGESTVKVGDIADVTETVGMQSISRDNARRYISVTASVENGYAVGDVNKAVEEAVNDITPAEGVTIEVKGQNEMLQSTFNDLYLMLGMAIVFIYLVMVAQFQSLLSPFIVMFTIPLAFTGGLFAMLITKTAISAVSLIGMVLLVGIVVNNGIVFVDYTNKLIKEEGMPLRAALIKAGRDRMRPILLTALTTVFAQVALCVDTSSAASMTQAMAITSIGGLVYATILTLFLVPSLYESFHKNDEKRHQRRNAKQLLQQQKIR